MLYLIRHGQTVWNVEHKLQGLRGSPLTEKGKQQATNIGQTLAGRAPVKYVFTSPLERCLTTLDILSEHAFQTYDKPPKIIPDALLCERSFGTMEGVAYPIDADGKAQYNFFDELADKHGGLWKWYSAPAYGECYAEVFERAKYFLNKWQSYFFDEQDCLVVTHSVVSKMIRAIITLNLWNRKSILTPLANTIFDETPQHSNGDIFICSKREVNLLEGE